MTAHSPLGASGAERWMNCPGSVALIEKLRLPESDEEDWRVDGIAAHAAAAHLLLHSLDAWEIIGQVFETVAVDTEMALALQSYVDYCRKLAGPWIARIETRVQLPHHPKAFGTADFAVFDPQTKILDVVDLKYGVGIAVDATDNPQLRYYGRGKLEEFPDARTVRLHIVQPRGIHPDGPIRSEEISAEDLCIWADEVLAPAMRRTETDHTLQPGTHCRFCPAKLICPLLQGMFRVAARGNPERIVELTQQQVDQDYALIEPVKFYIKALSQEMQRRLQAGDASDTAKLVPQKANRVWKPEAKAIFQDRYGPAAFTTPELKSPAEMEKLSEPEVKDLVHEWAFTPPSGVTVALKGDRRREVKVQKPSETFAGVLTPPSE